MATSFNYIFKGYVGKPHYSFFQRIYIKYRSWKSSNEYRFHKWHNWIWIHNARKLFMESCMHENPILKKFWNCPHSFEGARLPVPPTQMPEE